jgi:hypothetical protein
VQDNSGVNNRSISPANRSSTPVREAHLDTSPNTSGEKVPNSSVSPRDSSMLSNTELTLELSRI